MKSKITILRTLLVIGFALWQMKAHAQLSGTYTIGSGGNYTTLSDAVSDLIIKGVNAPVVFNILKGNYNEQLTIKEIPGANATNTVTFQSESGNAGDVIVYFEATISDNYIVRFDKASFITFHQIKFSASGSSYGTIIKLEGGSDNNTFINNIFQGASASSTSANLTIISSLSASVNNTTFSGNTFEDGSYAIYMSGVNTSTLSTGTKITGNVIKLPRAYGIRLQNQLSPVINGNTITTSATYAMYLSTCQDELEILKNKIDVTNGYGIYLTSSVGGNPPLKARGQIANNYVTLRGGSNRSAIYLTGTQRQDIYHNSVNVINTSANADAFYLGSGNNNNVVNNNFSNTGGGYAYHINNIGSLGNSDNNNFFGVGNYLAKWGTNDIHDLAGLQGASGKDAQSLSVFPHFVSNTDLKTIAPWLDNKGMTLASITDDINGDPRDGSNPDIGAVEFTADPSVTTPLAGQYTIGSGGDYASFTAATDDLLLKGISSTVTFNVLNGNYNENLSLYSYPGQGENDTVIFQSQSGNYDNVNLFYAASGSSDNYLVQLKATRNIVFRNLGLVANNALTASFGTIISLEGYNSHISFENNLFAGSPVTSTSTNLAIIHGLSANSNHVSIDGNTFKNGSYAIYLTGINTNLLSSGLRITDNTITSPTAYGIRIQNQLSPVINGNTIITSATYAMYLSTCQNELEILKNKIDVTSGYGIYLTSSVGGNPPVALRGLIANNFITLRGGGNRSAIYLTSTQRQDIYYNSVNVINTSANANAFFLGSGNDINVANNNFSNTGGGYTFHISNTGSLGASDNNNFFGLGNYLAKWGTNDIHDLAGLKSASGKDAHSLSVYPHFVSNTDLETIAPWLDNKGMTLTRVSDDINGHPRDGSNPDIGAVEFTADPSTTTPLAGKYTIGSGGNYASFKEATDDLLLKGVSATVTFDVLNGTYNENFSLYSYPGQGLNDTVIFQSQSGNYDNVNLFYAASGSSDNYLVQFKAARNIVFRNMGFVANNAITASFGTIISLEGYNSHINFENNLFAGSPVTSTSNNLAMIHGLSANSNHVSIDGNTFNNGSYAIYLTGINTNLLSSGLSITGNTIKSPTAYGIRLHNQLSPVINGNTITTSGSYAIYLSTCQDELEVLKNKIDVTNAWGIYLTSSVGGNPPLNARSRIANNYITLRGGTSRSALYLTNTQRQDVYHNSVNVINTNANSSAIQTGAGNDINLVNNIFANSGGGYAYNISTIGAINNSDYNNIYSSSEVKLAYWGSDRADLEALQTASGKDGNSVSVNPGYYTATDLRVNLAELDSAGTSLPTVADDIEGTIRNAEYPDIGAYEFIYIATTTVGAIYEAQSHGTVLHQNYPNPFSNHTVIRYTLSEKQHVMLKVYDITGIEIETLVNEAKQAGTYEVEFIPGSNLTSGVYFYRLYIGTFSDTGKMQLQ